MGFLIAMKIDTYQDGGTISVKYDNNIYFIDRRVGTNTRNIVYDRYPGNEGAKIVTDPEVVDAVLDVLRMM